MIKCTPKHRHLLGNERSQSRMEKVGFKPMLEMMGTFLNLIYVSTKYLQQILRFLTCEFPEK